MVDNKNIRVLVAEDDFLVAEEIARTVRCIGYEVVGQAADGLEAMVLAGALRPDLVLMDVAMPRMDGLEAAQLIRERYALPVVILTAHEATSLVSRAGKAGASAYLTKPSSAAEIRRAATLALARHGDFKNLLERYDALLEHDRQGGGDHADPEQEVLPVCAACKNVRTDTLHWEVPEEYLRRRLSVSITHGICPPCAQRLYPEICGGEMDFDFGS